MKHSTPSSSTHKIAASHNYYQVLKERVDQGIEEEKKRLDMSMEGLTLEIKKMVGRENYDKEKIINIINSQTVKPFIKATILSPLQKRQVKDFLEKNFLTDNLDSPALQYKTEAVFPFQRVDDTLEVLSRLGNITPGAKDIIAQFVIDSTFHKYFMDTTQQCQGCMGDAQSLYYDENTYFALHKTYDFLEKNKIELTFAHKDALERGILDYLSEQWLENLDTDSAQSASDKQQIELGLELLKLHLSHMPETKQIQQFKKILPAWCENSLDTQRFLPQLEAVCDKVLLEKELGATIPAQPQAQYKI